MSERIKIIKGDQIDWVKPDRLQRFLDIGWQKAEPSPKKVSKEVKVEVKVQATADVIEAAEESIEDLEAPLFSMPTVDKQGD